MGNRRWDRFGGTGTGFGSVFVGALFLALAAVLHGWTLTVAWAVGGAAVTGWAGAGAVAAGAAVTGWPGALTGRASRFTGLLLFGLAALRLLAWEMLPSLFGQPVSGPWVRAATFLLPVAAFYLSAWVYRRSESEGLVLTLLLVAGNLFTLLYITREIMIAFPLSEHGRVAGHQQMLAAAAWGLYGFLMAVVGRYLNWPAIRAGARLVLVAALGYLLLGAVGGNGRWALPSVRYLTYIAVLGSAWSTEYMLRFRPGEEELNGLVSAAAAVSGFFIVPFEVERWLEPIFTLPAGMVMPPDFFLWQEATAGFWLLAVWGAYALVTMAVGGWLRSGSTRLLAALFYGLTLLSALGRVRFLDTAWTLRLLAFFLLVPGALLAVYLGRRAAAREQVREERWALRGLAALALLTAIVWSGAELFATRTF